MSAPVPPDVVAHSVWAAPAILGFLMGASLLAALFGDGAWDALACLVLAGVLSYAGFAYARGHGDHRAPGPAGHNQPRSP